MGGALFAFRVNRIKVYFLLSVFNWFFCLLEMIAFLRLILFNWKIICFIISFFRFLCAGSEELMRGVGKDCTKLFDEVHAWVNYEQLLAKCYVGPLLNTATINVATTSAATSTTTLSAAASPQSQPSGSSLMMGPPKPQILTEDNSTADGDFKKPQMMSIVSDHPPAAAALSPLKTSHDTPVEIIPRFDWLQKTTELTIIIYTKALCNPGISVRCIDDAEVVMRIFIDRTMHVCNLKFAHAIQWPCRIRISLESGKFY